MCGMQIHEEALNGADRPCAPLDCLLCRGIRRLHKHGHYKRNADPTGDRKAVASLFICPQCRRTFSVIPRGMLPYRCIQTERLEGWLDLEHGVVTPTSTSTSTLAADLAGGVVQPPPVSEVELGNLRRASKRLTQRIPVLFEMLGQQMPVSALLPGDIGAFWRALRKVWKLAEILVHLAKNFRTSLLGDYLSLLPKWQREEAPS